MALLDYKSFVLNENASLDDKFDAKDVANAIEKMSKKISITEKKSTFEIWAYLDDRDSQSKKIDDVLKSNGFNIQKVKRASSSTPVTEFMLDSLLIRVVYKPIGGQAATTLHSTITELVPILLWKANYSGSADPDTMMEVCRNVDLNSITWAVAKDAETAAKYLDEFDQAPLYKEKMENAYGIYQMLKEYNPTDLIWCYRVKPYDIPAKSRADVYVESADSKPFGISVKAKSGSSKVRKMSSTFFELESFVGGKYLDDLVKWGWSAVYSGILNQYIADGGQEENPAIDESNYWSKSGRSPVKNKQLVSILDEMWNKNKKAIDEAGYYKIQDEVRSAICKIINENPFLWEEFLKEKIGLKTVFPVKVIEAKGSTAKEIHDDTEESISATIAERPMVAETVKTNLKSFIVKFGDDKKNEFLFDVWNDGGGNKTAAFYDFRIAQIG